MSEMKANLYDKYTCRSICKLKLRSSSLSLFNRELRPSWAFASVMSLSSPSSLKYISGRYTPLAWRHEQHKSSRLVYHDWFWRADRCLPCLSKASQCNWRIWAASRRCAPASLDYQLKITGRGKHGADKQVCTPCIQPLTLLGFDPCSLAIEGQVCDASNDFWRSDYVLQCTQEVTSS